MHVGQCGAIPDGCDNTINCGCPGGQVCAGGTCCVPRTCADFAEPGKTCVPGPQKTFADACGGTISCEVCQIIGF
jgi:hypothetical protein